MTVPITATDRSVLLPESIRVSICRWDAAAGDLLTVEWSFRNCDGINHISRSKLVHDEMQESDHHRSFGWSQDLWLLNSCDDRQRDSGAWVSAGWLHPRALKVGVQSGFHAELYVADEHYPLPVAEDERLFGCGRKKLDAWATHHHCILEGL